MTGFIIRDCMETDMVAVQRIYAHHVLHDAASFEKQPPTLAEVTRRREATVARKLPYLAPLSVRQGIGRALMTALIERCRMLGLRQMVAVIGDRNPSSIALHESLGFRLIGHLEAVGHKFDRACDATLMQRALAARP